MSKYSFVTLEVWQAINLVLYLGIDASWNKVQHWPIFDWYNLQSVALPTVVGLTIALVIGIIAAIVAWVTDI